jgi:hypothetical protein
MIDESAAFIACHVEFLNKSGFDDNLRDKQLVVIDDEVFWIQQDWQDFQRKCPQRSRLQVEIARA